MIFGHKPEVQVVCRSHEVATFRMGNRTDFKKVVKRARKMGAAKAEIFYHQDSLEIHYSARQELIESELFPYNMTNEYICMRLKANGNNVPPNAHQAEFERRMSR